MNDIRDYRPKIDELAVSFVNNKNRVTQVGVLFEDNTFCVSDNMWCHAGLKSMYQEPLAKNKVPLYIVSSFQTPHKFMKEEDKLNFIEYITQKSMYSDAFLDKDPKQILAQGYYVIDADMPNNVNCGAAMATRFISEDHNEEGCKVFSSMIGSKEINPNQLFAFSHVFGGTLDRNGIVASSRDIHNGYSISYASMRKVKNFVNNKRVKLGESFKKKMTYSDIDGLWLPNDPSYGDNCFLDQMKQLKPHIKTDSINFNIWEMNRKNKNNVYYITSKEDLYNIYEQYERLINV